MIGYSENPKRQALGYHRYFIKKENSVCIQLGVPHNTLAASIKEKNWKIFSRYSLKLTNKS